MRYIHSFLVFGSGFVEASADVNIGHPLDHDDGDAASDSTYLFRQSEDSDDEEDDIMSDFLDEPSFDGTIEADIPETGVSLTTGEKPVADDSAIKRSEGIASSPSTVTPPAQEDESRNVRPKLSYPSSPRSKDVCLMTDPEFSSSSFLLPDTPAVPGPKKMRVIVGDVAYATYRAVLYYVRRRFGKSSIFTHQTSQIYTDIIVFAPLSSSFTAAASSKKSVATTSGTPSDSQSNLHEGTKAPPNVDNPTSRREWIRRWQQCRPGRPAPCSAKAVYRLADSK